MINHPVVGIGMRTIGAGVAVSLFLLLWGKFFRPALEQELESVDPKLGAQLEAIRNPRLKPESQHVPWQKVDYGAGPSAPWYPKGESPILAELVAEGKLPPVEERVGPEPVVIKGLAGVGNYGGTWFRVASSFINVEASNRRVSCSYPFRQSPQGFPIVPHIAKKWEASEDKRVWTVLLRKGMRWSDGHPFTADDIIYRWTKDLEAAGERPDRWMQAAGKVGRVEKIDDHTLRYIFPVSNLLFPEGIADGISRYLYAPRHYLEQYHPKYGDDVLIEAAMKARNFTSRISLYNALKDWSNPEHPRLWPWVYRTYKANAPYVFVRNPYYYAVDTKGNQLPYVDRIFYDVKPQELLPAAATGGGITMQAFNLRFRDYTLLMGERESGDYEVRHWYSDDRSLWTIHPNLNRYIDPEQPDTRMKWELLNEKHFRQALSLAINRRQIINAVFYGIGEPAQVSPGQDSFFHSENLYSAYTEYDPSLANDLLDGVGLIQRDSEGFRTFPDGKRMVWFLEMSDFTDPGPAQFIIDDWAVVGIRTVQRHRSARLYIVQGAALKNDFEIIYGQSGLNPVLGPRNIVPGYGFSRFARAYGIWYRRGGMEGHPEASQHGGQAPPPGHPLRRALEVWEEAYTATSYEAMRDNFHEALDIAAENVWTISIATATPQLAVVKNGFKGVPQNVLYGGRVPGKLGAEAFYFENPTAATPGTRAEIKREISEITPQPGAIDSVTLQPHQQDGLRTTVRRLLLAIVAVGLILTGKRHPYIGRRLMIMVPTLFIISVISFIIIQAPPGDYLETRILQLEMNGEEASLAEIDQLKELFRLNEPLLKQYLYWLGLPWFAGFDEMDMGLLQGHMGRSMENSQSVNNLVGDRILLTFLISLGTILFTWAVALPIGIFSAIRQYSLGDYIFTFIGFIGMCIPNFLLALLLMYWANKYFGINMGGLFSPEFAAQVEWNFQKTVDLLQHIWLPVVVLGVTGTAGMIRVMRANLLDELKKPYVIAARAKGVRPTKLLLKYPVRMALNPFISGIGSIFPQLVSGGAIVAIVLSLPTVGPLMLNGLMSEDMYLAGSMLMVLSFLAILGTLVSDLLLMVLDPRIRMEGGAR